MLKSIYKATPDINSLQAEKTQNTAIVNPNRRLTECYYGVNAQ